MTEKADGVQRPTLRLLGAEMNAAPPPLPEQPRGEDDTATKPGEIFAGSPALALGTLGVKCFYLDTLGQLITVARHDKDTMRKIYGGNSALLEYQFPTHNKEGNISGWNQEKLASAMTRACSQKGVWNAEERVRGVGAWRDDDGGLILHCGGRVLIGGKWLMPGEHDGFVYPAFEPIPRPLPSSELDFEPGAELSEILRSWNWERGDTDAWLMLGWIVAAIFGGALKWRPMVWITGDAATGKSTLQEIMEQVIGGHGALIHSPNLTEPSIRATVKQSTIPVLIDEAEPEPGSKRLGDIIRLARVAASGGRVLRGSTDHQSHSFTVRNVFGFSSILRPPMLDQDLSRLALLELLPLPRTQSPPNVSPTRMRKVGRALRTRVVQGWSRYHETLELYRQALTLAGHNARGADQFGTLLAMADLVMHEDAPGPDRLTMWTAKLTASDVSDQLDRSPDWARWLNHLLGQPLDAHRGGRRYTVGRWVLAAAGILPDNIEPDRATARDLLPAYGLKVEGKGDGAQLMVANRNPTLGLLHRDTHWADGGWSQAAQRVPGSQKTNPLRFETLQSRAHAIPLSAIPGLLGKDDDARQRPDQPVDPFDPNAGI